jgi:hypothetical protein
LSAGSGFPHLPYRNLNAEVRGLIPLAGSDLHVAAMRCERRWPNTGERRRSLAWQEISADFGPAT